MGHSDRKERFDFSPVWLIFSYLSFAAIEIVSCFCRDNEMSHIHKRNSLRSTLNNVLTMYLIALTT